MDTLLSLREVGSRISARALNQPTPLLACCENCLPVLSTGGQKAKIYCPGCKRTILGDDLAVATAAWNKEIENKRRQEVAGGKPVWWKSAEEKKEPEPNLRLSKNSNGEAIILKG